MSAIEEFLKSESFAVCGASSDRSKYGNIVFRALLDAGRKVFPINPRAEAIEGHPSYRSLTELPEIPRAISIVTQPIVTRLVVAEAIELGVQRLWMQPGAEDEQASHHARLAGLQVIDDGSCILVAISQKRHGR
jgi:predicted CoA-binding protein